MNWLRKPSFLRTVAVAASSNGVAQVFGTGSGLLLAYFLEADGRGAYAAVMAWFGTLSVFGGLGITSSICYYAASNTLDTSRMLATAQRMLLGLGFAFCIIGLALVPVLARGRPGLALAYGIAFASLPLAFVAGTWIFAFQGTDLRRWSRYRIIQPVTYVALLVSLVLTGTLTVASAVASVVASTALQAALSRRSWSRTAGAPGRPDRELRRPLVSYGLKSLAAQAPFLINSRVDQLVLSLTVPLADLGIYAVAVSATLLISPLTAAFGNVAMPHIARQLTSDRVAAARTVRQAVLGTLVIGVVGACVVAVVVPPVFTAVFPESYDGIRTLILVLAPGAVLLGLNQVLADVLRGYDRALLVARAEGLAAVVTVVLLAVLIPTLGILGAAISSTLSYLVATTLLLVAARRLVRSVPTR